MAEISALRIDPKKAAEGAWVPWELDVDLLIAYGSSVPAFRADANELLRPHRARLLQLPAKDRPLEQEKIIAPAMAKHLLKGWRNLTDEGKAVPYTPKKGLEMFDVFPGMRATVFVYSEMSDWFRFDVEKESAKNL